MPQKAVRVQDNSSRLRDFAAGALLLVSILVVYFPSLHGGLVWDDDGHVTRPDLQSLHGLWRIWFDPGATQQYYPLLHSAFWLEHRLWGDAVLGYHLTNVVLHGVAAGLVVLIVRRLSLPGAWLAGFFFALHPISVEAVAWISEQKSTLSAAFYLGSALVYLRFDKTRRPASWRLALLLFVLALLSKTVTATLPAALLVIVWWRRGSLNWRRDALPLLPWFALGASAGLFTAWMEERVIGAHGRDFALTVAQRFLLAGRVIWVDAMHIVWPARLMFIYPRWSVDAKVWWQYLFPAVTLALAAMLALFRRARGPLASFLFFVGTLFPVLGFLNVYPFIYSWVADHFVYLASLGIIVPLAAGLTAVAERSPRGRPIVAIGSVTILLALSILTFRQSSMYQSAESLYEATLARNPGCWLAHNNLGNLLMDEPGRAAEAIAHLQASIRLQPDYPQAYNNLGIALSRIPGRLPEAISDFEAAVRIQPDYADAQDNLGLALAGLPGRLPEAIAHFRAAIRSRPDAPQSHNNLGSALSTIPEELPQAVEEYEIALRLAPDYFEARFNLGNALARVPGRISDAVREYEMALQTRPDDARVHNNLGSALSMIRGRLPDAISQYEAAVRINPQYADAHSNLAAALAKMPGRESEAVAEYQAVSRLRQ
jgi:tetratricopeptide (TPR) repeat protein